MGCKSLGDYNMSLSKPNKNDAFNLKTVSMPAVTMIEGKLPSYIVLLVVLPLNILLY